MKTADKESIAHLNTVLKNTLTGINQYFLHARMLKHRGDVKLADHEYKASIDVMKHSDMLVEHILASGGSPNLQELGKLTIGETASAMLQSDLALAELALLDINVAIAACEKDAATVALLNRISAAQQERIDFIQTQIATPNLKDCA